jgi:serine/threonine-protein kinase RsbW
MRPDQTATTNGFTPFAAYCARSLSEVDELRSTCQRQARVIDTLTAAVTGLRRDHTALKAETAALRAENARIRDAAERVEVRLPLDAQAPGAARIVAAQYLRDRVTAPVLDSALLLLSELVTNSVRHSGVAAGEPLAVRVDLGQTWCRVQVEDPGRDGVIAPRPADAVQGSGMGLNLVQMLSERWGLERASERGTWVWAQLSRAAAGAGADFQSNGTRPPSAGDGLSHVR